MRQIYKKKIKMRQGCGWVMQELELCYARGLGRIGRYLFAEIYPEETTTWCHALFQICFDDCRGDRKSFGCCKTTEGQSCWSGIPSGRHRATSHAPT